MMVVINDEVETKWSETEDADDVLRPVFVIEGYDGLEGEPVTVVMSLADARKAYDALKARFG